MADDGTTGAVKVAVRLRPMNEKENARDTLPVVTANSARNEVTLIKGTAQRQQRSTYNFDAVFGSFSEQSHVFDTVRPLVDDVLNGYEATVRQGRAAMTARAGGTGPSRPPDGSPCACAGFRVRPDWHRQDAHHGGRSQGRPAEGRHPARCRGARALAPLPT